jgi:crotonobetainyl-CoA:carnitine CoA-transferase CaiB-like acyl-CoA transferase
VACVVAARDPVEANYLDEGSLGRRSGFITTSHHRILDETPRLKPLVEFSRSSTVAGDAGLLGQHTEQVLRGYGYGAQEITALSAKGVIILG